jgi:hypothetical protein
VGAARVFCNAALYFVDESSQAEHVANIQGQNPCDGGHRRQGRIDLSGLVSGDAMQRQTR